MLDLIIAAALSQAATGAPARAAPCHAWGPPSGRPECPAWLTLSRDTQGELMVDPDSLRRDGSAFEITVRYVYAEAAQDVIRSIATGFRFDCAARTVAMGRGHAYDDAGVQLDEEEPNEGYTDPAPVLPDAREAVVLTEYCPR